MGGLSRLKKWISVHRKRKRALEREASRRATLEDAHEMVAPTSNIASTNASTNLRSRSNPIDETTKEKEVADRQYRENMYALSLMWTVIEVAAIIKEASEASSILSPLQVICVSIDKVLKLAAANLFDEIHAMSLTERLNHHRQHLQDEYRDMQAREAKSLIYPPLPLFMDALQTYLLTLDAIHNRLKDRYQVIHGVVSLAQISQDPGIVLELETQLDEAFRVLIRQIQDCIIQVTFNISHQVSETRLSQLLSSAVDARGDRVRPLTPGTRVKTISQLDAWAHSQDRSDQIFWLHDNAGTGKSTLAAHMARKWHLNGTLAAHFFFNQDGGRSFRTLDRFYTTLVREISENYPSTKHFIFSTLENPDYSNGSSAEAFDHLLATIVGRVSAALGKPLIFVIDALDECADDDVQIFLTTLLSVQSNPKHVRFFLTSRPTPAIKAIFDGAAKVGGKGVVLLDVKSDDVVRDQDVAIYVRHTLSNFPISDQDTVIECARGVFLWATLACDTLQKAVARTTVLRKFQSNIPHGHMASLYETVLETALPPDPSAHHFQLLKSVLQGVTLACRPISIFSIQSLFPKWKNSMVENQDYVEFFVKKLGSIMKDGTPYLPIYLLHPTFREFIEDQRRGAKFYISPPAGHCSIAIACLDLLSDLTHNVLGLYNADTPVPRTTPSDIDLPAKVSLDTEAPFRYAITFWATHAALALEEDEAIRARIVPFLESSFLKWLEWSSALRELPESAEGLHLLRQAVRVQRALGASEIDITTEKWCVDSLRFLQRNGHLIAACGLQAWISALVFTPKSSIVYQKFHHASLRALPEVITDHPDNFDSHRILHDAGLSVYIANVSPDGKRMITHEGSGTLSLWNLKTFKLISILRHQQSRGWAEAQFSSDGSLIESGGGEAAEIHLWNGFSGTGGERLLPNLHSRMLIGLVFTLSDRMVVSIARDNKIVCWSVVPTTTSVRVPRGTVMRGEQHNDQMNKIVTSLDGKLVATFSRDHTIRLWSTERKEGVGNPLIGDDEATDGSFSLDGTKIIAGYGNGEVIIWDVRSENILHRLERDESRISNITISPDGRTFASGHSSLRLWDIDTGNPLCPPLVGYTSKVTRLAFDSYGNRLVSGSRDHTLRLWDIRRQGLEARVEGFALRGHTRYIQSLLISPDGRLVISASPDGGTVRVWDTDLRNIGENNEIIEYTHDIVHNIVFFSNGSLLVTAGSNGTLQLWNTATGKKLGALLKSPEGNITTLSVSLMSLLWASGHSTGNVCLWRQEVAQMEPEVHTIFCELGNVKCISFTPDDSHIAIGGKGHMIQVWDIVTLTRKASLDCSGDIDLIAISYDGRQLSSYSIDKTAQLWDLITYKRVCQPITITYRDIHSIAIADQMVFSPDGKTLSIRWDRIIQLFDVENGLYRFLTSYLAESSFSYIMERVLAFSADSMSAFVGHHILDIPNFPRHLHTEIRSLSQDPSKVLDSSPVSPLFVDFDLNNIYSMRWPSPVLMTPADLQIEKWVAYKNLIAIGTNDGRVFILRFPKECI